MQTIFTGGLMKSVFEPTAQRTFVLNDTIDTGNDGLSLLGFYLAENAGDGPSGYTVVQVHLPKQALLPSPILLAIPPNFLCVVNLSDTLAGHYNVNVA